MGSFEPARNSPRVTRCRLVNQLDAPHLDAIQTDDYADSVSGSDSRTLALHGHSITYAQKGSGPLLLLIHGMAGSLQTWRSVIEPLARHATVLAAGAGLQRRSGRRGQPDRFVTELEQFYAATERAVFDAAAWRARLQATDAPE